MHIRLFKSPTAALAAALLAVAAPQAQPAPDAVEVFKNAKHGLDYYLKLADEEKNQNSVRTANLALFSSLYTKNFSNNEATRLAPMYNTRATSLTTASNANTYYTTVNAVSSKTAFNTNYLRAFETYNNVITGPNNQNEAQVVAAALNLAHAAWESGARLGQSAPLNAYYDANLVVITQRRLNNHRVNENAANSRVNPQRVAQNAAYAARNSYLVIANSYRRLDMYRGHFNSQDQSLERPAIAAYEQAEATNTAILMTGGFVGVYATDRSAVGNRITDIIIATAVRGARENNTLIADASHDFENRLHNISRARFAANDTANNAYKSALNTVANKAETNFAARGTTPLSSAEVALNAAADAWNQNDTTRNNVILQGNLSTAAKAVANSANNDLRDAVTGLFNVELEAVAASVTADAEYTSEEFAFTGALNNLGVIMGFKGSEFSRNTASALRRQQRSMSKSVAQGALSAAAFTSFNAAYEISSTAVEAALLQVGNWQNSAGHLWALRAQFAASTLIMQRNLQDLETSITVAAAAIDTAATSLAAATTSRNNALDALVAHVVALTGNDAAPYATHIATINSTSATAEQKSAARLAIAVEVNTRATDTDTTNDPSAALAGLSTAYQTAKTDYNAKFRAKAQADLDHYNFLVARRDARKALADFAAGTKLVIAAETDAQREKLADLSRALRGADLDEDGTADHDKPLAILDISMKLHSLTTGVSDSVNAHADKLAALSAAIAENHRLIERNKASIIAQGRRIYEMQKRSKAAAHGIAAAYALASVPQIPGKLNLTISAGEFDGEQALGVSVHGQVGSKVAFSGAVVRSGSKDGLALGITLGLQWTSPPKTPLAYSRHSALSVAKSQNPEGAHCRVFAPAIYTFLLVTLP